MYKDACCICSKATSFALTQRVRPAFLGWKSIIITVSWCFTMQEYSRKPKIVLKKPPKEKGQTPMTSVCPFQEKRIVNMAIVALPIQVMGLVSLVRL